jgi:hypothetical protein
MTRANKWPWSLQQPVKSLDPQSTESHPHGAISSIHFAFVTIVPLLFEFERSICQNPSTVTHRYGLRSAISPAIDDIFGFSTKITLSGWSSLVSPGLVQSRIITFSSKFEPHLCCCSEVHPNGSGVDREHETVA